MHKRVRYLSRAGERWIGFSDLSAVAEDDARANRRRRKMMLKEYRANKS